MQESIRRLSHFLIASRMTGIVVGAPAGRYVLATAWLLAALVGGVSASSSTAAATENDPSHHDRQLQDWTTIFVNDFDDGTWQDFTQGNPNPDTTDTHLNSNTAYTYASSPGSIRLRDNDKMNSSVILNLKAAAAKRKISLADYEMYQIKFWYYVRSFENTEDFFLEYCPEGTSCPEGSWQVLGNWQRCCADTETSRKCQRQTECHFNNDEPGEITVPLPISGSDPHLRFRADASGNGDYLYIDQVEIMAKVTGTTASPSARPSVAPTAKPSVTGSDGPSVAPSGEPSVTKSDEPSAVPTAKPSVTGSEGPSAVPTAKPSVAESDEPSVAPTNKPTATGSDGPSAVPVSLSLQSS